MSVKYVKGSDGKFRGSRPDSKSLHPSQPFATGAFPLEDLSSSAPYIVDDAWAAFEQSKRVPSDDPLLLAKQALDEYRKRVDGATSQDDLYEAQDIYHEEIANIPLGKVNVNLDAAWDAYQSLDITPDSPMTSPSTEPHGWLVDVAARSNNPEALKQVWEASEYLYQNADETDPRLDTADSIRLQVLEFNPRTPASVFEDAYSTSRLDGMRDRPESDYADHLVRLPVDRVSISESVREDVATRLCEWAESSADNAQDIDDATSDASGVFDEERQPLIPVLMTDINPELFGRFRNSPSKAIAASLRAADDGYRLIPRKV